MIRTILMSLLALLAAAPSQAAAGRWTPFGPGTKESAQVAVAPGPAGAASTLYGLVPDGGVHRSRDGGKSWEWWSLGIDRSQDLPVHSFAVDARQPLHLVAARSENLIYRSVDGGRSWTRVQPIPNPDGGPGILTVAAAGGDLYAGTVLGLYALREGEWRLLFEPTVYAIAFDPADPDILYAGTLDGLWKSADGGGTWAELLGGVRITAIAVPAADPARIYAAGEGFPHVSSDGGATWTRSEGPPTVVDGIAVDAGSPDRVYLASFGLSVSDDGGATWTRTSSAEALSVAADPARPGTVYAATIGSGVLASHDGGRTWRSTPGRGLGLPFASLLERDPAEGTFYLCFLRFNETLCHQSLDGGAVWSPWDHLRFPTRPGLNDLAFDRREPRAVYAAGQGIFRVEGDSGRSLNLRPVEAEENLRGVAVSRGVVVTGGTKGVYRSLNRGRDGWKKVLDGNLWRLIQDPDAPAILYAALLEPGGELAVPLKIYRSLDTGGTWTRILVHVQGFAIDPTRPRTLYAVQGERTLVSRDRGETWRSVGEAPGSDVRDLVVHPSAPSVLLAGTWGEGVRISRNGGRTWSSYNAGLARPGLTHVRRLVADPVEPGRFFALMSPGGTYEITVDPAAPEPDLVSFP